MAISLTKEAAEHVRRYLDKQPGVGLRVGVRRTGCSGWAYVVEIADQVRDDDRVFEDQGLRVIVAESALKIIDGTEVGFVNAGLNRNFVFKNPNAGGECGCGESFSVN